MAEYYRILSYLYRYDKKNKMDCKGFVKAEQKKNGLKITLQIDDERLVEDIKLTLYFYKKEEDQWKIQKLAVLESSRHHEETMLFYPSAKLPEGFDIRKQYGVILFYQEALFYGSVWIGDEIPVEELLTMYQERPIPEKPSVEKKQIHGQSTVEEEQKFERESEEREDNSEIEQKLEERKDSPETQREPEEKEDGQESEYESQERKDEEESRQRLEESKENQIVQEAERLDKKISTESEDLLQNMWISTEKKAKLVDNIFNPAFRSGYQISIEQLGALGPEARNLSDNQFMAKGYAMYHHLLAGKVIYAGKERYCVGVPGIYENRERYMAQLYQFPVFLSLTENRIKTGGFGYWLHLLQE